MLKITLSEVQFNQKKILAKKKGVVRALKASKIEMQDESFYEVSNFSHHLEIFLKLNLVKTMDVTYRPKGNIEIYGSPYSIYDMKYDGNTKRIL